MSLPSWFKINGPPTYQPIPGLAGEKARLLFLDRTLSAVAGLMADFIFAEAYTQKAGLLQGLDPRFKLIGLLVLIIGTSLLHSLIAIYGLCLLALLLAVLSRVEAVFFLKRVWFVLPLFAGLIALPATLNFFTPGDLVWKIGELERAYRIGPYEIPKEIGFSEQGLSAALFLVGRVGASLSFVLLLTLTTPWASILKAVRSLGVPRVYVQTLGMALRYLMLLSRIVGEMHTAKKSRTLRTGKIRLEQRWVAGQAGALFARSLQLSSEVHRAMVARGYQGEVRILIPFQVRLRDHLWLGFCVALSAALVYFF
jgi:cobalt/nickel transport system permease protein